MATLADYVHRCLETRLSQALLVLWKSESSVRDYWMDSVGPLISELGYTSVATSLAEPSDESPAAILIKNVEPHQIDFDESRFYEALEQATAHWREKHTRIVLLLDRFERWNEDRWRDQEFAFRSFLEANQDRLFPVLVCSDPKSWRRQFLSVHSPLYRQGMMITVSGNGNVV